MRDAVEPKKLQIRSKWTKSLGVKICCGLALLCTVLFLIHYETSYPVSDRIPGLNLLLFTMIGLMAHFILERFWRRIPKWERSFKVGLLLLFLLASLLFLDFLVGAEGFMGILGRALQAVFTGIVAGVVVLLGVKVAPTTRVDAIVDHLRKWFEVKR